MLDLEHDDPANFGPVVGDGAAPMTELPDDEWSNHSVLRRPKNAASPVATQRGIDPDAGRNHDLELLMRAWNRILSIEAVLPQLVSFFSNELMEWPVLAATLRSTVADDADALTAAIAGVGLQLRRRRCSPEGPAQARSLRTARRKGQ